MPLQLCRLSPVQLKTTCLWLGLHRVLMQAAAAAMQSKASPFSSPKQGSSVPAKECDQGRTAHITGDSDSPHCNTDSDATSSDSDSDYSGCSAGRPVADSQRNRAAPSSLRTAAVAPSSDPAGASGVALSALQGPRGVTPLLPRFVRCQQQFSQLCLPVQLCSTLANAAPSSSLPVQVSLTVHGDDWSPEQYVLSHGPNSSQVVHGSGAAAPPAAMAANTPSAAAADPAASSTLGPFSALAVRRGSTNINVTRLQHGGQLLPYTSGKQVYQVVLVEQVRRRHRPGGVCCSRSLNRTESSRPTW